MRIKSMILYFGALLSMCLASCDSIMPYRNKVVEKEPTCTEDGVILLYDYANSSVVGTETIPATGHKYTSRTIAPTCTQPGYDIHICSVCGYEAPRDNYVPALGHNYVVNRTDPTCHTPGYVESYCSRCGEPEYEPHYIEPLQHYYVLKSHVTPIHCGEQGYDIFECTLCGDTKKENYTEPLAHDFVLEEHQEADCYHGGYDHYVCSRCGQEETRNEVPHLEHDYAIEVIPATCLEDGYTHYQCRLCGHEEIHDVVPKLEHDFEIVVTEATCTESKIETKICRNCGAFGGSAHIGESLGHDISTSVYQQATCTKPEILLDTCSRCDYTHQHENGVPLGHDYQKEVFTPATCTEPACYRDVCSRCGDALEEHYCEGEPLGHDYHDFLVSEATCTSPKMMKKVCSRCQDEIPAYAVGEALGHDYQTHVLSPATCVDAEVVQEVCERCGDAQEPHSHGTPNGHMLIHVEDNPATCTETGITNHYLCANCNYSTYDVVPMLPHSYFDIVQNPTCTSQGYTLHMCTSCGYSYADSYLDPLPHDLENEPEKDKEPTCAEYGERNHVHCKNCDYEHFERVAKLPHYYYETPHEATCTEPSYTDYDCLFCGAHYENVNGPALGHDLIHHSGHAASCDSEGYSDYDTCSRCDYSTYQASQGPIQGHNYVLLSSDAPGLSTKGSDMYYCTRCGRVEIIESDTKAPSTFNTEVLGEAEFGDDDFENAILHLGKIEDMPLHHYYSFRYYSVMKENGSLPSVPIEASQADVQMDYQDKVNSAFAKLSSSLFTNENLAAWHLPWSSSSSPLPARDGSLDSLAEALLPKLGVTGKPVETGDRDFSGITSLINAMARRLPDAFNFDYEGYYYYYSATADVDLYVVLRYDTILRSYVYCPYSVYSRTRVALYARPARDMEVVHGSASLGAGSFDFSGKMEYATNHPLEHFDSVGSVDDEEYHELNYIGTWTFNADFASYYRKGYDILGIDMDITWKEGGTNVSIKYQLQINGVNIWGDTAYLLTDAYSQPNHTRTDRHRVYISLSRLANGEALSINMQNNNSSKHWLVFCNGWVKLLSHEYHFYVFNSRAFAKGAYANTAIASYQPSYLNGAPLIR